jgi:hypothetical protein
MAELENKPGVSFIDNQRLKIENNLVENIKYNIEND